VSISLNPDLLIALRVRLFFEQPLSQKDEMVTCGVKFILIPDIESDIDDFAF